jgi:hypothetical protein
MQYERMSCNWLEAASDKLLEDGNGQNYRTITQEPRTFAYFRSIKEVLGVSAARTRMMPVLV